uniref:Uncharacterized protein n=1 Tax=Timema cristinae TaxID=61476 RepID=A0A7R9CTD2_TIMCR|nr:unnamed protein product [Timema cristinae]
MRICQLMRSQKLADSLFGR